MVTLDIKNCKINVISFDLAEIKTRCHLWKGNQGLKFQKSPYEEEAMDVSCVEIKIAINCRQLSSCIFCYIIYVTSQ
jgi:hypothetical protein